MSLPPLCVACQRLRPFRDGRMICAAFTNGIPTPLLEGLADHRQPYPGDRGIRFEPDWAAPAEVLAELPGGPGAPALVGTATDAHAVSIVAAHSKRRASIGSSREAFHAG